MFGCLPCKLPDCCRRPSTESKLTRPIVNLLITAIAPAIWGSTYIVATELLPGYSPVQVALLRALPTGLLLLLIVRRLPTGIWWLRVLILGALNFAIFWSMMFASAYRLPGGVAATIVSLQPLMVVFLAAAILQQRIRILAVVASILGIVGVGLLVLMPQVALDAIGIVAGLIAAASMALGTVLTRRWQPPATLLTFTAWQLSAGGVLLLPVAFFGGIHTPVPTTINVLGLLWLCLVGAALTYVLWFRGIAHLDPAVVSSLSFLSPATAVLLGWLILDQTLTMLQITGICLVVASIWLGQRGMGEPASSPQDGGQPVV